MPSKSTNGKVSDEAAKASAKAGRAATSKTEHKAKPAAKARQPRSQKPRDICFVICPFGGWHDDYHEHIFCTAIKAVGLDPRRADDLFRPSSIVHDIWSLVSSCKVMLADLTGKNPNVFYELGLAHAAGKPVLLVTQTMDDVPFDLRALRVITYDVQDPSWGDQLRDNIKTGLKEILQAPEGAVLPTFLLETPTDQPKVSPDEHRYLALQQQIDTLRSELRTSRSSPPVKRDRRNDINPEQAKRLIASMQRDGVRERVIVDTISQLGPPARWIEREMERSQLIRPT